MGHDPRKQEALADGYRNWERKSRLTRSTPARGYMLLYWGKIYRKKKTTDKRGSLVGGKVTKGSPHWLWQFVMRVVWGDSKEIFMLRLKHCCVCTQWDMQDKRQWNVLLLLLLENVLESSFEFHRTECIVLMNSQTLSSRNSCGF